jgi:hypothetical protein
MEGHTMASKEAHSRSRKIITPNPKRGARTQWIANWTALQANHNFEGAVIDQLKSEYKKAFLKAFQSSQQTKSLRPWMIVVYQAAAAGYLQGPKSERVGGRVPKRLFLAAKKKSGIQSQSELLEYALSKVALEDDYGKKLIDLKGSIPDDVEF